MRLELLLWQVPFFDPVGIAGARLGAGGHRLPVHGRCNTSCNMNATFAQQMWLVASLGIGGARLEPGRPCLLLRGRRNSPCIRSYFCG